MQAVRTGHQGTLAGAPAPTNRSLYTDENPLGGEPFETKVKLLADIDAYAREKDRRVKQVIGVDLRRMAGRRRSCARDG